MYERDESPTGISRNPQYLPSVGLTSITVGLPIISGTIGVAWNEQISAYIGEFTLTKIG
jgi:hypothetical protein